MVDIGGFILFANLTDRLDLKIVPLAYPIELQSISSLFADSSERRAFH